MKNYLTFEVTQKDIDTGKCGVTNRCAVAKALIRKTHKKVDVDDGDLIEINGRPYKGATKNEIRRLTAFINKFDEEKEVYDKDGNIEWFYPKKVKPITFSIIPYND